MNNHRMVHRFRAFFLHFIASLFVVGTIVVAMHLTWYPPPLAKLQGWTDLLWVVFGVNIVLGPVLTFVVYAPGKKTLRFDLTVIASIQIAALSYGVYTSAIGRPVYLVFLSDRFEVVTAAEYPKNELEAAKNSPFVDFSWLGPKPVTASMPHDINAKNRVILSAVTGGGIKIMPRYYLPYTAAAKSAAATGKNLSYIQKIDPQQAKILFKWIQSAKRDSGNVVFVPLKGKLGYGLVMIDSKTGNVLSMEGINPSWY